MKYEFCDGVLKINLDGRVDAYTSDKAEEEIFKAYNETNPEKAVIDCTDLEYIASAGLRILLKLGKNCEMSIVNVSRDVYELLDMTGFTGMFDTKRIMRQVSVEGCKVIGTGFSSKVYRIDKETVVKVYEGKVTLERIYNETASAKKSFVSGIPTAIPYDVVRCGDAYGTVFELIDAVTLSRAFMDSPERFDELMDNYVKLLKKFHSTPALSGTFPDIHDKYHSWAAGLKKYLTEDEVAGINRMIDAIPDCQKMIHVDCHSGNIMSQNGKLTFVDMADVSIGHPLVDIGSEYFHYVIMRSTSLGAKVIFGVEPSDSELPLRVWQELVKRYFKGLDGKKFEDLNKLLKYFGCMRCLIMVAKHAHMEKETAMELVDRQRKDLFPYIDEAVDLISRADEFFI